MRRVALVPVIVVVALALVAGAVAPGAAASSASEDCSQSVTHDFRVDKAVSAFNSSGEATSRESNTEVRVVDGDAFVRIQADNPNAYCVSYEVLLPEEVADPATLGGVDSVTGTNVTAQWDAVQDFEKGTQYTRVEFQLAGGQRATFAPSRMQTMTLSWTGDAERASGFVSGLLSDSEGPELKENTYEISPDSADDVVTVDLTKNGSRVEEWHATYNDGIPVGQDPSDPVYYEEEPGEVTLHFNQKVSVEFVANPSPAQSAEYRMDSYTTGFDQLFGIFGDNE